jgi:hypothetical protein
MSESTIAKLKRRIGLQYHLLKHRFNVAVPEGKEVPFAGNVFQPTTKHVANREILTADTASLLEETLHDAHPDVLLQDVCVQVGKDGFGTVSHHITFDNPALEPGKTLVFWGDHTRYRDAMHRARQRYEHGEVPQGVTLYLLEELLSTNLRIRIPSDVVKEVAKRSHRSLAEAERMLKTTADVVKETSLRDKLVPSVDWKKVAESTIIVEVPYISTGSKKVGPKSIQLTEPGIQIYDPLTGFAKYDEAIGVSRYLEESGLTKTATTNQEKLAEALRDIAAKNTKKAVVVLYREIDPDGRSAIELSHLLKVNAHPIVEEKQFYENAITIQQPQKNKYMKFVKVGLGAALAAFLLYRTYVSYTQPTGEREVPEHSSGRRK